MFFFKQMEVGWRSLLADSAVFCVVESMMQSKSEFSTEREREIMIIKNIFIISFILCPPFVLIPDIA